MADRPNISDVTPRPVQKNNNKPSNVEEIKKDVVPLNDKELETDIKLTMEQSDTIKRIKSTENLYKILGINSYATHNEIKVSSGKLLSQLNIKSNKATEVSEAYKKVKYASEYLLDAKKRKTYDSDLQIAKQQRREKKIPKKFWYQYFDNTPSKIGLLVASALILSIMIASLDTEPHFSLMRTNEYNIERRTNGIKVPYYVKKEFCNKYYSVACELESKVENEFMQQLKELCEKEKINREAIRIKAKNLNDKELKLFAETLTLPSCESLKDYIPDFDF